VTPDYSVPPPVTGPNSGVADEGGSTGATGPSSPSKPDERVTNGAGSGALPLNPALGAKRRDASWGWDVTGVVAGLVVLAALTPPLVRLRRRRRRFAGTGPTATPTSGHRLGWSVRSGSARPSGSAPVGGSGATPDSARLAWQEVADTALDLGILPSLTASPRATAGRWATHLVDIDVDGTMSAAALRLGAVEERARYGGQSPAEIKPVIEDAQLLVSGLERSSRRRDRLRAWLLPRSLLRAATIRARGWQEGLAARLRRHRPAMGFGPRAD
jgi:hypothetical protein